MKKHYKYLIILLLIVGFGLSLESDDKELFLGGNTGSMLVKPNVVILMDSSGSMNTIIFYPKKGVDGIENTADDPGYNPLQVYSGGVDGFSNATNYLSQTGWYARWVTGGNAVEYTTTSNTNLTVGGLWYWTGCYATDGTGTNFQVGSNSQNFYVGDTVLYQPTNSPRNYGAVAKIKAMYTSGGQPWVTLENIVGGPITVNAGHFQKCPPGKTRIARAVKMYGTTDSGNDVRWPKNYLVWLYMFATDFQRTAQNHFATYGTFDVNVIPAPTISNCATPGNDDLGGSNPRIKQTFTRIQTAREVVCNVASDANKIVKLGLFTFGTEEGGVLQEGLTDMSDESSALVAYKNNVWGIAGSTWTPLAEALTSIWYYIKPGPASKTLWPVDWEISHNTVNHSTTNPVTPVDYWCQNNYVVLMTDGESTKDGFNTAFSNSIFKLKPVRRTEPWTSWNDGWGDLDKNDPIPSSYSPTTATYCPNYTCWLTTDGGTDYLDDVAYFLRHQDMFPDSFFGTDPATGWPGDQNIYTYTIGFTADNHLLRETAINGDGAYYTANNFDELVSAFKNVITSINLRNFAFSAITAPRKTVTATNDDLTLSYVGFFMPSATAAIWEGHLLAHRLTDFWGYDEDDNGTVDSQEFVYGDEEECLNASAAATPEGETMKQCSRRLVLNIGQEWDAADKMLTSRNLYTHDTSGANIPFNISNLTTLTPLFGSTVTDTEATTIINKISSPFLADIFHSDVGFVSPPPAGKQYLPNLNSADPLDEKYSEFYSDHMTRPRVLYVGTNDGILHMFYGDGANAGVEGWGFIPDDVLPSLKKIVIDSQHTYTVDGRLSATDIYFKKPGYSQNSWSSILTFGLRGGGKSYYTLDISDVEYAPKLLWKFKDTTYSGESWGKPVIGKIKLTDPNNSSKTIDKWVEVLAGGFAFTSENPNDKTGKAIFVVDATDGSLLWMIGYDNTNGAGSETSTSPIVEVTESGSDPTHHLTKRDLFNFPIPSAVTVVDVDNNGYMDTIYYGNIGGHLFKTDIHSLDMTNWTTTVLYKTNITQKPTTTISTISGSDITVVNAQDFVVGDTIRGATSYAVGYITAIDKKVFTVTTNYGAFQLGEAIVTRLYDPIYLAPAVTFDNAFQMWVAFGTGDRDRPRTGPYPGRFIGLKENYTMTTLSDFIDVSWSSEDSTSDFAKTDVTGYKGWYTTFRDDPGEKLFDPEPIILPDANMAPHIYFNTYTPPLTYTKSTMVDNPCDVPREGVMSLYEVSIISTNGEPAVQGSRSTGRIAGGGTYQSKEYVIYKSDSSNVGSVPDDKTYTDSKGFSVLGGVIYWKEKKR